LVFSTMIHTFGTGNGQEQPAIGRARYLVFYLWFMHFRCKVS